MAFSSCTPSSVAAVWTGYSLDGFATPASSAAVSVMILKTDPGGCGAEYAMPASASTSPSDGRITATPPKRPASAATAAPWIAGSIVVRTAVPRRGATEASTRSPARSTPPGRPVSSASNSRSRPVSPTDASAGTPRRASSAARSGGAGPMRPATSAATAPSSEARASPSASGVPSRAWIAARGGSDVVRDSFSPGRSPGWTR